MFVVGWLRVTCVCLLVGILLDGYLADCLYCLTIAVVFLFS